MTPEVKAAISELRDAMYRAADGLGDLVGNIELRDVEIARLQNVVKELSKFIDEQAAPIEYKQKDMH